MQIEIQFPFPRMIQALSDLESLMMSSFSSGVYNMLPKPVAPA
ncbi:MAG: hypothetical protein ACLVAP_01300 [Parasutterella sp.]